ncbi:MAG TPA: SMI1/KNR4 family protein, partial [Allosphingosinicella sp.]
MLPPTFAQALQAWLAFLAALGFRADAHLNPPAAPEAIARAEAEIGYRFPDDLRALYLRADGQRDTIAIADPAPG